MSGNAEDLRPVVEQMALDIQASTVVIELICSSDLGARVLFEDLCERYASGRVVVLTLACGQVMSVTEEGV